MPRAKFIAAIGLLLAFFQLHCAIACAASICPADLTTTAPPPCHRHHQPAPSSCVHLAAVVSNAGSQADMPGLVIAAVLDFTKPIVPDPPVRQVYAASEPSPPGQAGSSFVLRL